MKIVIGFRPISDSALRISRLKIYLENLGHQVKTIAANVFFPFITSITWCTKFLNKTTQKQLEQEFEEFQPDLVISDLELESAKLAQQFKVSLWYYTGSEALVLNDNLRSISEIKNNKFISSLSRHYKVLDHDLFLVSSILNSYLSHSFTSVDPISIYDIYCPKISKLTQKSKLSFLWSSEKRYFNLMKLFIDSKISTKILGPVTERYKNVSSILYNLKNNYDVLSSSIILSSGESEFIVDAMLSKKRWSIISDMQSLEARINMLVFKELRHFVGWQIENLGSQGRKELELSLKEADFISFKPNAKLSQYLEEFEILKGIGHPL